MRGHSKQVRHYRGLLALYIKFIYFTGVRPGEETADIQWRDLTVETDFEGTEQRIVRINARKEGKSEASKRSVVPRKILWPFLDQWRFGTDFNKSEDYIFCHEDGTPIKSFVGSFRTLLKELRKRDPDLWEGAYSLYCTRHSYATHMLQRGKADAWQIARNMGHTDIEMIRTHYGQDKPIDHGGDLSD
jgi:integrase